MKIRPVGAEMSHADGQTDMTEPTVAFRSFASAPKRGTSFLSAPQHSVWVQT